MKTAEEILNEVMLKKGNPALRSLITETEWRAILFAMETYAKETKELYSDEDVRELKVK